MHFIMIYHHFKSLSMFRTSGGRHLGSCSTPPNMKFSSLILSHISMAYKTMKPINCKTYFERSCEALKADASCMYLIFKIDENT